MITDYWEMATQWLEANPGMTTAVGVAGVALSLVSLLILPWFFARLPADYFNNMDRHRWGGMTPGQWLRRFLRNVFGLGLLVLGIVMLVVPGQGLLTMIAGIVLIDFPGKYALERSLARRPRVERAINWLRQRSGQPPIDPVED